MKKITLIVFAILGCAIFAFFEGFKAGRKHGDRHATRVGINLANTILEMVAPLISVENGQEFNAIRETVLSNKEVPQTSETVVRVTNELTELRSSKSKARMGSKN